MPSTLACPKGVVRYGDAWSLMYLPCNASATFVYGDWLKYSTGVTLAVSSGSTLSSNEVLVGFAGMSASDAISGSREVPVWVPDRSNRAQYLFALYSATAASAVMAAAAYATPTSLPLRNTSTGWALDVDGDGTDDRFIVMDRDTTYPASETYGTVWAAPMFTATGWLMNTAATP